MKENDLGPSLMLNMLKCSFLFVNYIYLIDFTVFKVIDCQLLKKKNWFIQFESHESWKEGL